MPTLARPALSPADLDLLTDLLLRYDEAKDAGRPVTPQELCADTPHLLADFTRMLKNLGKVDAVFDGAAVAADQVEVIDAGRYDPLSYQAEGGLGVVYLAEDSELKRPVALKWMKPLPGLDPVARRRFLQEAEITGKLEHPGIAPVYGAGHDPRGRPYYAMRFIHGGTLADAIEACHARNSAHEAVAFDRLLRAFISVCQTVGYAHARGVIHRDLKPGNVMLGPYGETLVVDWGLAKRIDLPDPNDTVDPGYAPVQLTAGGGNTVYGQVKGSPAYMAPEQARGETDRVGPAADVYALGATLYTILTGRAPYPGKSAGEIIDRVKHGPPPAPRAVSGRVPKPLDAICRQAMSRNESDRYATPVELAADVERWLTDQPVTAYRDPLLTRARRWVKRHRTAVATAAAALFVVGAALAVVVPLLAAKNRELTDKSQKLEAANANLAKANTSLASSNAARKMDFEESDRVLRGVMENLFARAKSPADPLTNELRADAVRQYVAYLETFIRRNADRPEMRLEVAVAWEKVGDAHGLLGKGADALAGFAESEARFRDLLTEQPADRDVRYGLACALAGRGLFLSETGKSASAVAVLSEARARLEELAADPTPIRLAGFGGDAGGLHVDSPVVRLAAVSLILADLRRAEVALADPKALATGRAVALPADARGWLETALRASTGGKPLPPTASPIVRTQVLTIRLSLLRGQLTGDRQALTDLRAEADELAARYPGLSEVQLLAMEASIQLGHRALEHGKPADAEASLTDAQARLGRMKNRDFALDPFGFRPALAIADAEVAHELVRLAADRKDQPAVVRQLEAVLAALRQFHGLKRPTPDNTIRGVLLCLRMAHRAVYYGNDKATGLLCQEAAGHLVAAQLAADPDDPHWQRLKLLCDIEAVGLRLGLGKAVAKELTAVDRALTKLLAATPDDPFVRQLEVQALMARGAETNVRSDEAPPHLRLKLVNEARETFRLCVRKLDDARRIGLDAAIHDHFRAKAELLLALLDGVEAYVHWQKGWFRRTSADEAAARTAVARAAKTLSDIPPIVPPADADDAMKDMFAFVAFQRKRAEGWIAELRKEIGVPK